MKARREMFSISDMASLEWGEITLEDFVCQKSGGACHLRRPPSLSRFFTTAVPVSILSGGTIRRFSSP